jgi:dienelactone hydrolase
MKKLFLTLLCISFFTHSIPAQDNRGAGKQIKISANPEKGFYWDYYLLIPDSLKELNLNTPIFVLPNNTGTVNDSIEIHEKSVLDHLQYFGVIVKMLHTPMLVPVFPRPRTNWKIYTHALDRDVMTTDIKELNRLDLQLISMINDARELLKKKGITVQDKIFIMGFSASGQFANRFTLLHPELVKASAVGSPGGMPMVPVKIFNGKPLRYPIGIDDFSAVTGSEFNSSEARNVDIDFFLGDQDKNDAVVYRDAFEEEDEDLIMKNFGTSLQERWEKCRKIYEENNFTRAKFTLYPGVDHKITQQMKEDLIKFFISHLAE